MYGQCSRAGYYGMRIMVQALLSTAPLVNQTLRHYIWHLIVANVEVIHLCLLAKNWTQIFKICIFAAL